MKKWINHFSSSHNVIPLVTLVFLGFLGLILFVHINYSNYLNQLESVIIQEEAESQKMRLNSELMELARARTRLTSQIIDTEDPFEQDELNLQLENYAGRFTQLRTQLLSLELTQQEKDILHKHTEIVPVILPAQRQAVELAMSDNPDDIKRATKLLYDIVLPGQGEMVDSLGKLIAIEQQSIAQLSQDSRRSVQSMKQNSQLLIITSLTAIILLSTLVIFRIRNIQGNLFDYQTNLKSLVQQRTVELTRSNKALEESLTNIQKAQDRLVETEKMVSLGQLVSGIAHEVNTPIGISVTATSHLSEELQNIKAAYKNGELTQTMMSDFLETSDDVTNMLTLNLNRSAELIASFKQVSVDQSSEQIREFDLKKYLAGIIRSLEPQIRKTEYKIELACPEDIIMHSMPGIFSQIFTNLVLNSLLHGFDTQNTESTDGLMKIDVSWQKEKNQLCLNYSDNGRGMSEEQLKNVFEPFYTTKRGKGGTGLGMFIIYNLITQKLGGEVFCSSCPGEGVNFHITLPYIKPDKPLELLT